MGPLVAPSWLADRLQDPGTVVLDATLPPVGVTPPVDTRSRYLDKHIPGAIFFDIEELSDHATTLPHMLPTPEAFSRSMSTLGIGDNMTIVVYEQQGVFSAPRAWWMLRHPWRTARLRPRRWPPRLDRSWPSNRIRHRPSRTGQLPREARPRRRQRPDATQRQHRKAPADSRCPFGRPLQRHSTGAAARSKLRPHARRHQRPIY